MRIGAVEAEMCIIIAQWPVQNFWSRLNRENGTFCNHHLHISRERLGVRRWNFHQTVAHRVVYLMKVSSCTELYGFQEQHAEI